jgi:hypothetical protein
MIQCLIISLDEDIFLENIFIINMIKKVQELNMTHENLSSNSNSNFLCALLMNFPIFSLLIYKIWMTAFKVQGCCKV